MKYILIFLTLFLISGVIAQGECVIRYIPEPDGSTNEQEFCCPDDGNIFCDDNYEVCGPNEGWCENYLSDGISCIPGTDWCCYSPGFVVDYSAYQCCPPELPFWDSDNICHAKPVYSFVTYNFVSTNYYTTQSDSCIPPLTSNYNMNDVRKKASLRCNGNLLEKCEETSNFVYHWGDAEAVVGECGAECISDGGCGLSGGEIICDGNTLREVGTINSCVLNQCESQDYSNVIEVCEYCGQVPCPEGMFCTTDLILGCIDKQCEIGETQCQNDDLSICQDNGFQFVETCELGCSDGECISEGENNLPIIVGIIVLGLFIIFKLTNKRR